MSTAKTALPARERLLRAADKLFYEEGINSVGIDRIIEKAGVAKASLYASFGSKDELVAAYLARRHERRIKRVEETLAPHPTPRAKMVALFESQAESAAHPAYRGCAFVRADSEASDKKGVKIVCGDTRTWMRGLLRDLATEAGIEDADGLASQLLLLQDGASATAQLDRNPNAARVAGEIAARLWDDAVSRRTSRP